jgi:hypothetical protein
MPCPAVGATIGSPDPRTADPSQWATHPPAHPPSRGPPEARLDSWKEIAAYLERDVTTVQRWERREGMPVHRHLHDRMGSVYAYREELDAWARSRKLGVPPPPAPPPRFPSRRAFALTLAVAGTALAIGAGLWLQRTEYPWRNPVAEARFQAVTDFGGGLARAVGRGRAP